LISHFVTIWSICAHAVKSSIRKSFRNKIGTSSILKWTFYRR
jgi:hypothetical protein